jgi:hypothetical protein
MKIIKLTSLLGAAGLAASLAACGGGGDGGTAMGGGQSTFGVVTGFGSVYVKGVEYETSGTSIDVDGVSGKSEDDLKVGMMVCVQGSHDGTRGTASSISAHSEVEGVVTSTNIAAGATTGTIGVMGYTVNIEPETVFESYVPGITALDQIAVDNIVEVSGYSNGMNEVFATRIEVKAVNLASYVGELEVKGIVQDLGTADPSNPESFSIGSMVVDYSGALMDVSGALVDGMYVEVESIQGIVGGKLIASRVEDENDYCESGEHHSDDEYEMRGKITMDFDGSKFMIDNTVVIIDDRTELEDLTTSDLVAGTMVEVEGYFDEAGNLLADEVEAEDSSNDEIKGTIESIDQTDTNVGTITLTNGYIIHVSNTTIMYDDRDEGMTPVEKFNLGHLDIGNYIEVYGVNMGANEIDATKIEREDYN